MCTPVPQPSENATTALSRPTCWIPLTTLLVLNYLPSLPLARIHIGQAAAGRSGQVPSGTRASPRPTRWLNPPHRCRGLQRHATLVRWLRAALLPTGYLPSARATIGPANCRGLLHHLEDPACQQASGGRVGGGRGHEGEQALH